MKIEVIKTNVSYKWNTCLLRILLMLILKQNSLVRTILSFFKYQLTTTTGKATKQFLLNEHCAMWEYFENWMKQQGWDSNQVLSSGTWLLTTMQDNLHEMPSTKSGMEWVLSKWQLPSQKNSLKQLSSFSVSQILLPASCSASSCIPL